MTIKEPISVIVSFGQPYRLRPVRFRWTGRVIDVKEITYMWETRDGQARTYHFAVSDGTSLYEISFDSSSLIWRLENTEAL